MTRNVPILEQILSSAPNGNTAVGATLGTHRVRAIDVRRFALPLCRSPRGPCCGLATLHAAAPSGCAARVRRAAGALLGLPMQVVALLLEECKPAIDKAIFATGFIQRAPAASAAPRTVAPLLRSQLPHGLLPSARQARVRQSSRPLRWDE